MDKNQHKALKTTYRKAAREKDGKMRGREAFLKTVPKHKSFNRSRIKH
jgi:hypothetical protein